MGCGGALYLLLDLYTSSLTVGILRSRWIVSLVTYQGASVLRDGENLVLGHVQR